MTDDREDNELNAMDFSQKQRETSLIKKSTDDSCLDNPIPLEELMDSIWKQRTADPRMVRSLSLRLVREAACRLLALKRSHPRFSLSEWAWISEKGQESISRSDANKFLFGCILEYQAGRVDVWDNAAFFIEEILGNPDNIWSFIAGFSLEEWNNQFWEYNLHKDPDLHTRLWTVASRMLRFYSGDARNIWDEFRDIPHEVFRRLLLLQIPPSTANLVIGALKDEHYLNGARDIVADVVDSRVIGRVLCGVSGGLTPHEAVHLARLACPSDPWNLDRPLYVLGMSTCGPGPRCRPCPLKGNCVFEIASRNEIAIGSVITRSLCENTHRTEQKTLKNWQ